MFAQSDEQLIKSYVGLGISLAIVVLISLLRTLYQSGFEGEGRSIEVFGANNIEYAATNLGGFLIMLTAYFGIAIYRLTERLTLVRIAMFAITLIAVMGSLRLGSRTQLFVAVLSLTISILILQKRGLFLWLIVVSIVVFIGWYGYQEYIRGEGYWHYFSDRTSSRDVGISSLGGRVELWLDALAMMPDNPFGWTGGRYAHNFWLDVMRRAGYPALLLSILITFQCYWNFYRDYRESGRWGRALVICAGGGFAILFMIEPIMDGYYYPLAAFFAFSGLVAGRRNIRLLYGIKSKYELRGNKIRQDLNSVQRIDSL